MGATITIENAVKRYGNDTIINGLSLEVKPGEFFTLLGPSGCGKTTLLRMIIGFNSIEGGTFKINDRVINDIPTNKRNIGMVFQNYAVFPHMNVFDNVAFGLRNRKLPKDEIERKVNSILKVVKIDHLKDRMPANLSGGQQQRVALARAIVIEPEVLLMDEPLSNLDAKLRVEMRNAIKRIQQQFGITTVYVTHDQEEALAVSDRIAVMDGGVIQQIDTPQRVYQRPANRFVSNFIGLSNFLNATVSRGEDGAELCFAGSDYRAAMTNLRGEASDGMDVLAAVRPEEFLLSTGEGEGIPATVRSSVFLGTTTHYFLTLPTGQEIEAVRDSDEEWAVIPGRRGGAPAREAAPHQCLYRRRKALSGHPGGAFMRYAGEKRFNGWTALTLVLLALFLLFVIYPIGMLLIKSLFTGGKIDLSYFVKFFTKKYYWGALINSFKVTVVSTLVASLIGVPMAYLLRSVKIRGAGLINILIVISYLSPPFIGAYSSIQLLGRNGFITRIINALFGVKLPGIYGFAGIVLVFSLQSFPLIYMYVSGAMKNLDNSLNEAAESLGCNAFQRVTKIIFPLVMPSLLAGALLVFMRVFADFGTPMIIGEGYKTFPVMLYTQFMGEVGTNDGFAATMCLIVIVIALMFFFLQKALGRRFTYSMSALKPMEAADPKGWRGVVSHIVVYLVALVAALPQITVLVTSFIGTINGSLFTGEFTLDNYRNIFAKSNTGAITNSYLFGLIAIVIVVVCGILISYLSVRKRNALTSVLDVLTMFPYIIPGSVLGISFLYAFNGPPFMLGGTVLIIVISLSIRRMPYTIRSSTAIIGQISPSVEEASISLGASQLKTFLRVTIPMMLPGVLSGAIMSWITLISELSSSVILYTSKTMTLTVAIYSEVIRSNFGNAAAYSTILTLTSIVSLLVFFKLSGKKDLSV